jgi:hypothetical protein
VLAVSLDDFVQAYLLARAADQGAA